MADNKRGCWLPQAECARHTQVYKAGEAPSLSAGTHCASKEAGPGQFLRAWPMSIGKTRGFLIRIICDSISDEFGIPQPPSYGIGDTQ